MESSNTLLSDDFGGDFPIVQYADDTLLILPVDANVLFTFKGILRSYSDSTGLHVNFQKSSLVLINLTPEETSHLANIFGCQVGGMSFTYLGLPLGTTKSSIQDFTSLTSRIERRLGGFNKMLSYHGKLVLVNSVLSALPTYYMCTLQPPPLVEKIDRYRKHCIWSDGDINRKGTCLAAWSTACLSKEDGGLGIINLNTQNATLLMKHLDKFYNHSNIPWLKLTWDKLYHNTHLAPHARSPIGSFWWKDVLKLYDNYKDIAKCSPSKGNSIMFWQDDWHNGLMCTSFPELFSFARKPKSSICFFLDKSLENIFYLPLSKEASDQLDEVILLVNSRIWDVDIEDEWIYSWGNKTYTPSRAYKL